MCGLKWFRPRRGKKVKPPGRENLLLHLMPFLSVSLVSPPSLSHTLRSAVSLATRDLCLQQMNTKKTGKIGLKGKRKEAR